MSSAFDHSGREGRVGNACNWRRKQLRKFASCSSNNRRGPFKHCRGAVEPLLSTGNQLQGLGAELGIIPAAEPGALATMSSATWLQPPAQATPLDAARGLKPFLGAYNETYFNGVSIGANGERDGPQAFALCDLHDLDVPTFSTPQARVARLGHRIDHSREVLTLWWLLPSKQGASISAHFTEVFILGMITAKAVTYFSRGSRDHNICVAFSVFILWCKAGLNIKILWDSAFFLPYRHHRRFLSWSALTSIIISQIPVALSQMYLCHRLWAISKKNPVPKVFAVAGTLCSTTLYIIYATLRIKYRIPGGSQDRAFAWVPPWAFCTCKVVGDQLDYMLLRLASLSITTCLPPALISAIMAILEITKSTGAVWTFFKIILASTYVLCIIHSLNSRQEIVETARGSRSTMRNPLPLTPGPSRPLELALAGQRLTDSTAMMITPRHTLKSKPHSFSLSTRLLGALTAPKRPSMNPEVELEESAFSAVRSENHHPRPLQDTQLTKSQDGS
ncbi:BZ3500_MvSof-1268-A1-R1_Chr1-3g02482 [Microbotryum saponariae]|uniref:BZ3500_MvSof-1268-A1-R1_Chr1-3g02482 protein n=1 Tax=Microbotryum saponariae TaxID=289078 RepID=A0A2X0KDK5_9BASI|nr:BZ3500_MvSof-1268-A1-R1_Chr1-3g02482 [Microbotryum saponariae]SCZ96355.1 BZ3501_MvSof-1269-A2-R1_Chr1-3g02085 [Microbotryum saponariae]